jgi:hypothetical protein
MGHSPVVGSAVETVRSLHTFSAIPTCRGEGEGGVVMVRRKDRGDRELDTDAHAHGRPQGSTAGGKLSVAD